VKPGSRFFVHSDRALATDGDAPSFGESSSVGPMGLVIYCADIGSVPRGRFAWARSKRREDIDARPDGGIDIADLLDAVAADLASHHPVALGFECPLFAPVPELPDRVGTKRETDKRPNRGGDAPCPRGAVR
jgi:hypothetical protein